MLLTQAQNFIDFFNMMDATTTRTHRILAELLDLNTLPHPVELTESGRRQFAEQLERDKELFLEGVEYIRELAKEMRPLGEENVYCGVDYDYDANRFRFRRSDADEETVRNELYWTDSTCKENLQVEKPLVAVEFINSIDFIDAVVALRRYIKRSYLDSLNDPYVYISFRNKDVKQNGGTAE